MGVKRLCVLMIRAYQRYISPLLGRNCRFYPTCSEFTAQAIEAHGAARGILLGAARILRCGPWSRGGFDPVPEEFSIKKIFQGR